jgi:hypothetical protein
VIRNDCCFTLTRRSFCDHEKFFRYQQPLQPSLYSSRFVPFKSVYRYMHRHFNLSPKLSPRDFSFQTPGTHRDLLLTSHSPSVPTCRPQLLILQPNINASFPSTLFLDVLESTTPPGKPVSRSLLCLPSAQVANKTTRLYLTPVRFMAP